MTTGRLPIAGEDVSLFGWSGGFVAFDQTSGADADGNDVPVVIHASASADGDHWSTPVTVETGFKGMFRIESIVEGPQGLLALAFPYGDTCGGPSRLAFLWASTDGRAWQKLPLPKGFAGSVETISGGGAGYIARGTEADGLTPALWTSPDARTWTGRKLPTVSSGKVLLASAVTAHDGFVLAGGVEGEGECGGPGIIHPAIWWSADGAVWTRAALSGASAGPYVSLVVQRIGDRLLAIQTTPAPDAPKLWSSADGRTWTPAGPIGAEPADLIWRGLTEGRHVVVVVYPDTPGKRPSTFLGVDGTGRTWNIDQTGEGPTADDTAGWNYAVGPTGILAVLSNGTASWLGVPS